MALLAEAPKPDRPELRKTAVLRPSPVDQDAQLLRRSDGAYVVRDKRLEDIAEKLNFDTPRSEEHTSELQSLVNLVCRLLLEKKKK